MTYQNHALAKLLKYIQIINKMIEVVKTTKGDATGTIDDLISFLNEAKEKGATNYSFRWSGDPIWAFKWFETYRIKSEEEIKQEEIISLQKRLSELA